MKRIKEKACLQKLIDLYVQYGFYKEHLISITKKGMDGQQQIAAMMEGYRNNPPKTLNGSHVVQLLDYEMQEGKESYRQEKHGQLNCRNQMCCNLYLADGTKISARPSGTEPKIKFYFSVNTKLNSAADFDATWESLDDKINAIISDMKL